MINNKFSFLLCIIFFAAVHTITGQNDTIRTDSKLGQRYQINNQLWLNLNNSAGLKINKCSDYNNFGFHYNSEKGDFKPSSKPETLEQYGVSTSGYKSLDKVDFQGSFHYNRYNENEIGWVSMMDTERNHPFHIADSTFGDWKKDFYTLNMKMGTAPFFHKLRVGLSANYQVAQGGRDNDPRPKSVIKDFTITPGVVWDINSKHHFGATFNYRDYRQDLNIMNEYGVGGSVLYKVIGLALLDQPIVKSSLEYRIDNWTRGGSLQYGAEIGNLDFIAGFSYDLLTEKAIQSPYKGMRDSESNTIVSIAESDVRFSEKQYGFSLQANVESQRILHSLFINADNNQGKTYFISSEQVEYLKENLSMAITYEMIHKPSNYSLELFTEYFQEEQENLFYGKQIVSKTNFAFTATKNFSIFLYDFAASLDIGCSLDFNSSLEIDPESEFINESFDITEPYVYRNFYYGSADYYYGKAGFIYYLPLKLKSRLFTEINAGYYKTLEDAYFHKSSRVFLAGSIGLLF